MKSILIENKKMKVMKKVISLLAKIGKEIGINIIGG
jgi:hypothetical protein